MKLHRHKIFLFAVILSYSFSLCAQTNVTDSLQIDSLKKVLITQQEDTNKVNTLNELSYDLGNSGNTDDSKNAIQYAEKAISIAGKINFDQGKATGYRRMAWAYYSQSNYPFAIKNALISLKLCEELRDKPGQAKAYMILQAAYGMEGNYSENLKNVYASLKLWEELGDKEKIASGLINLGVIYADHGNPTEAMRNTLAALKLYNEIGNKEGIASCYQTIGYLYFVDGRYTEALQKRLASLKLYEELGDKGQRGKIGECYQGIGNIYEKQGELIFKTGNQLAAISKFLDAQNAYLAAWRDFQKKDNNKDNTASIYVDLGNISMKLKKFSEARAYLQKGLPLSKEAGFKNAIRDSYGSLATLDSIQQNYKQAFEHYKMYVLYRDSILNQESLKKSVELKMQYEFDKKESIAKATQAKKDAESKRTKNLQYFAIATLGVVVFAAVIIALIQYRNNKHKQKANLLLERQKQKIELTLTELKSTQSQLIQSEKMASLGELTAGIAHEIQNPLNFVNNFSEVNKELITDMREEIAKGNYDEVNALAKDVEDNEEKINHHGKRAEGIVRSMLQHSRSSTQHKEPTDINALADEYLRLSYHGMRAKDQSFNSVMQKDFDESIGKINIIPQDIGRVLLNLYNNAFYALGQKQKVESGEYKPTVTISTKKIGDKVEIKITDNGSGIPQKVVDKIFQPFFTTKPTGQGTGLGLSLSYDIVKVHGGEIKVNTREGAFTEFVVHLPIFA